MAKLKEEFRKSSELLQQTTYSDTFRGIAFVKFYLASGFDGNNSLVTFLTLDTTGSDSAFLRTTSSTTLNFDIDVETPFIIAGKICYITYFQESSTGQMSTDWTLQRIRNGATTNIGSVTGDVTASGVDEKKLMKFTLNRTVMTKGDTLRLKAEHTAGSNTKFYHDPSGGETFTDSAGRTVNSQAFIAIPIIIPI